MIIEMIPLNQLTPSRANVRKTNAGTAIEELAASIEAHGLLQNLTVRAAPKGKFEVVAGGRRLAAMNILRRRKKLVKDFPVPCHVISDVDAGEVSLAENVVRLAMHPADQFEAFKALSDNGMGLEDIAARFGVSVAVVRQRLKLASVSPALVEVYRESEMTLDQLMAFTVSDDHAAQEAAWFDAPRFRRDPRSIRATLTEAQVEADDRRVRFAGLDTYRAAGGGINRDLFEPELRNDYGQPVEEFEIQFIDGETIDAQLFEALGINQCNHGEFFEAANDWSHDDKVKAIIAVGEIGIAFKLGDDEPGDLDIDLYEVDTLRDLAVQFVDEGLFGDIPKPIENYLDYDAIARDLAMDYGTTTIDITRYAYRGG